MRKRESEGGSRVDEGNEWVSDGSERGRWAESERVDRRFGLGRPMAPPYARRRGRAVRLKVRAAHLELWPLRRTLRYRLKIMLSERSQGASVCAQAVVDGGMRRGTVRNMRRPRSFAHEFHPSQRQALEFTEERQLEQQTCFCSWDLSSASRVVRTARSIIGLVSPSMHVRRAVPSLDHAPARAAGGDRDVCA
jgi:hypothetical protein